MKEKNIKTYGLIIGIVLFLLLIAGFSYAWYAGQAVNNTTIQGEIGMCFEANSTKGGDVSGDDLLLLKKDRIINNGQITITNGMAVTSLSVGMDNITCPDTYGYMDVYMKDTTISNALISGDSAGGLKYVIASYDSTQYPSTTVSALNGVSFDIVKEGTVDTASDKLIFTDPMLPQGTLADYLIIFYLDGDLTFNDIIPNDPRYTIFSTTISAIAHPSVDGSAKSYISNLSTPTGTVTNNSIIYNVNTDNKIIVDTMGNVRYYGADPDNYIYFNCDTYPDTNCETWRIIGVVDGKLKLIRNTPLGSYSWDTNPTVNGNSTAYNQWGESVYSDDNSPYSGADLMKLLNPGYESNEDLDTNGNTITVNNSLYYNSGSGTCYTSQNNGTTSCDFTSTGIKNIVTKNRIANAIYYTGGWNSDSTYSDVLLDKERGTLVKNSSSDFYRGVTRTTFWQGRIALAYPSDYGYAADLSACNSLLSNYGSCVKNNWMKKNITNNSKGCAGCGSTGLLLTPNSNYNYVFRVDPMGHVVASGMAGMVAPVLYLLNTEIISGGNGTIDNPYKLSA